MAKIGWAQLCELAFIDKVLRLLVEAVDPQRQAAVQQLLLHAEVVVVVTLGSRQIVAGSGGLGAGADELRHRRARDQFERRRREIAGVAGVDGGAVRRLPDRVDARTDLVLMRELVDQVEAGAVVDRQFRQNAPLVLKIDAI